VSRRSLLALVVTFFAVAVAGVGFAGRTSGDTSVYGLVNANGGRAPTFQTQDNMKGVRRVGLGRYCLLAAVAFDRRPVGQLTTDIDLSGGRRGVAVLQSTSKLCTPQELAVVTFQFAAGGRLVLSNQISFIGDPEG